MSKSVAGMPAWVPWLLKFAAIYNLAWGIYTVLFPKLGFQLAGMEPPNYPSFIQCLGMVIGVYGVGYWIAATDAARYWPVVLVGLLGKIFGPIGFVYAFLTGELPVSVGFMVLVNDVVWWLPFTAILIHAMRIREAERATSEGLTLEQALRTATTNDGRNLYDLSFETGLLIVCIRHFGCTFCLESLADLARQKEQVKAAGLVPVVVQMASQERAQGYLKRFGLEDVLSVSDPDRRLFRTLELPFGSMSQFVNWRATWRAFGEGVVFRHWFGPMFENGLQLPGAFVIRNGVVVRAFRHQNVADRTDFAKLSCEIV